MLFLQINREPACGTNGKSLIFFFVLGEYDQFRWGLINAIVKNRTKKKKEDEEELHGIFEKLFIKKYNYTISHIFIRIGEIFEHIMLSAFLI